MFHVRRNTDGIPHFDFLDGPAPLLHPTCASGDDESLAEWMRVPCRAGTGIEGDERGGGAARRRGIDQTFDASSAGEILRGSRLDLA